MADELIVNYYDACIYNRDLSLIESPTEWLNSACIHFYTTFLQRQQVEQFPETNTFFIDPSVISFLMHQCHDDEELKEFADGSCGSFTKAESTEGLRLVVPINDHFLASPHDWAVPSAGMHWSLLVLAYHCCSSNNGGGKSKEITTSALHLDSAGGNLPAAQLVAQKIQTSLCRVASHATQSHVPVVECKVPKQQNGSDCGIHVLAASEAILPLPPLSSKTDIEDAVQAAINLQAMPNYCLSFRRKFANCIQQLTKSADKKS